MHPAPWPPSRPSHYTLRVEGHLDPRWSAWFEGLTVTPTAAGETVIAGPLADQAALHGLLAKLRDLNLTLIAVQRFDPPPDRSAGA